MRDPRKSLIALSWNIGSLRGRLSAVHELLVSHAPHLLLLQEARDSAGAYRALHSGLRDLGYVAHINAESNRSHMYTITSGLLIYQYLGNSIFSQH